MIFCSSEPSWISEETSETMSRNSRSWSLERSMRSTFWVPWSATAAWVDIASSNFRSSLVKRPRFLFRVCTAPMTSPVTR
jgi:hypothetical protein